ncbi:MAG: host-nuclease inhibitor Gam family protein [Syntrophales bacterium]
MASIEEIEQMAKEFSAEREKLSERVRSLEDETSALKRKRLPLIRAAVKTIRGKHDVLKVALEASKGLFVKPKTRVFHGVKLGFQKAKGKISWPDDEVVVKLIKKHLPEQAEILIKTTEKPIKDALANLPAADLKKIGVTVEETTDQVVIKSTDGEIDKLVDALLKEKEPEKDEEAAA